MPDMRQQKGSYRMVVLNNMSLGGSFPEFAVDIIHPDGAAIYLEHLLIPDLLILYQRPVAGPPFSGARDVRVGPGWPRVYFPHNFLRDLVFPESKKDRGLPD